LADTNPDSNKLIQLIRQSRPTDMEYISVNQLEKDSVKKMLKLLEKYIGKKDGHVFFIRK
jgi:low affinity Fe/Cu permease